MNLTTSPVPAADTASSALVIDTLPSEQEVSNLRAQLQLAEEKAAAERLAATVKAHEALRGKIASIPAMLGVPDIGAAIALIVDELDLDLVGKALPAAKAPKAKRGFPTALSEETKAQMRAMFEGNATSREVAAALGIGVSTADSWKAKMGLTHKGLGGRPGFKRAPKARKGGRHIPPVKRAKIVEALKKPGHSISVLSRRFAVSRQTLHTMRHDLQAA